MATNYNVSGLVDYIAADPTKVLSEVILSGKGTKDYFDIETGVKFQTKVPNLSSNSITIGEGTAAPYFAGDGQTTITEVTLENKHFYFREIFQKQVLDKTIAASLGRGSSEGDAIPFADVILNLKGKVLFLENEKTIWLGDTVNGTGYQKKFDGVIKQIVDASTFTPTVASAAFSSLSDASILANVTAIKNKMALTFPEFVGVETVMAMSPENFSAWAAAKFGLNGIINNLTLGSDAAPIMEAYIPGTMIKVAGLPGLAGNNTIVLTTPQNIIQVVDLVSEDEELKFWFSPDANGWILQADWKLGVKVVDPSKVIKTI